MVSIVHLRSIIISLLVLLQGNDLIGQNRSLEHHAAGQPLVENTYGMRPTPVCIGEKFYTLEGEEDKKHPLKKRYVLNAYERGKTAAIVTRELQFEAGEGEKFDVRNFFTANGGVAVLYRLWNEKTGLVRLFAIGYDPNTLEPLTKPAAIGEIPFDPKSYYGTGPLVQVVSSANGEKQLFYFDRIKMSDIQLVMCWVTDAEFVSEWSAIYKVPVHSSGSNIDMHFSDEGAVYQNVSAVLLTEENTKEKADGSTKVTVKNKEYRNKQATFFKLHDDEFLLWKCELGNEFLHDITMDVVGNKVWFSAIISASKKDDPAEWLIGTMEVDFSPRTEHRINVKEYRKEPEYLHELVMDENGAGYVLGGSLEQLFICGFDASGKELYQVNMKWSPYLSINAFAENGRLYLGVIASSQDTEKPDELQLRTMNPALFPVLIAIGDNGKLKVDQLVSKEDGGQQMYGSIEPDFEGIKDCGYFIDFSYDKKRPGIISVPMVL